jgi:hypothetical protein
MISSQPNKFIIKGEVIEITEQDTHRNARIISRPELIVLTTENKDDLHLGDQVIMEVTMLVEKVGLEILEKSDK